MEDYWNYLARRDKILQTWLFMDSALPVCMCIGFYLFLVMFILPKYMKHKKAYELKYVIMFYNLYQVIYNAWQCIRLEPTRSIPFLLNTCRNINDEEQEKYYMNMAWWVLINKFTDLCDTFFILLKKKNSQINFLHLYHHSSTIFYAWVHLKYGPGDHTCVVWFLNSFVHMVMYFYYFLSGLGPKYQKYLWWKKYLTKLQLVQFLLFLVYIIGVVYFYCQYSFITLMGCCFNSILLIILFSNFYKKSYTKKIIKD